MSFGEFGERYELAAMKAAGIPLTRVMTPLLGISTALAIMLFSSLIILFRTFRRKPRTCFSILPKPNRLSTFLLRDSLLIRFRGYMVKFDKIYGENGENIEGVFVHKKSNAYENQQSVVAEKRKICSGC